MTVISYFELIILTLCSLFPKFCSDQNISIRHLVFLDVQEYFCEEFHNFQVRIQDAIVHQLD